MSKAIIVSAVDEQYLSLAQDLVESLRYHSFDAAFDIGVLDLGLSAASLEWFKAQGVRVERAGNDIDYPRREQCEAVKPGFRALTARLFMRNYFPGYDSYMWMDADVWVQTPEAINAMLTAVSKSPAIHISCELDRCYTTFFQHAAIWHILKDWYLANYGEAIAASMTLKPMLNAGIWAMAKDSPVWDGWIQVYTDALQRMSGVNDKTFMADQLGLNILLYLHKFPHVVLPANFNWLTSYALPMFDRTTGMYVEPAPPYRPIAQLHLTRPIKIQTETIHCVDGGMIERPLTFSGWKR